jgi:hypothetical protein
MGVVLKERKEVKALLLVIEACIKKDYRKRL